MIAFIYKIVNLQSGKFYIGSTTDTVRRWSEHKGQLEKGVHINKELQKDYNCLGIDYFEFQIIETVDREVKDEVEESIISKYLGDDLCYNENPNNKLPYKKNKVYLYDVETLNEVYSFDSYVDLSQVIHKSAGKISDAIWNEQEILYDGKPYKIGLTPKKFQTVVEQILSHNSKIYEYDIHTLENIKIYNNPKEFLENTTHKDWRSLLTKYILTNKIFYFENETQPTKAMLNDRNTKVGKYDKYGRLVQIYDKKDFQRENKENWERIRGVARKNSRALLSDGKANFNKTFDGFIYLFGEYFEEVIKVHLIEIQKEFDIHYFSNKQECGDFLGVTKSAIAYACTNKGLCCGYTVKEILATDCDILNYKE